MQDHLSSRHAREKSALTNAISLPGAANRPTSAALEAVAETGLAGATFPAACPWTFEQVLDGGSWPG